jgi:hypothetical protein
MWLKFNVLKNIDMTNNGSFNSLNPKAEIFEQIKKQQPAWWKLFCEDEELYIEIRKDNYINVYYFGGCVAKIKYEKDFVAEIHEKYSGRKGDKYIPLDLQQLSEEKIAEIKGKIKDIYLKKQEESEKPAEKYLQGKLLIRNKIMQNKCMQFKIRPNQSYIDSEFAYNLDKDIPNLRIDLIELSGRSLSFVELKGITDPRLRNDEKRNTQEPEIIEQMNNYQQFINKYEDEIIDYYKRLIQLKNDLCLTKQRTDLKLNKTPKLLIVNTYQKTTKGREERIKAILELLYKRKIKFQIISSFREIERKKTIEWCKHRGIKLGYFKFLQLGNSQDNFYNKIGDKVIHYFQKQSVSFWTCSSINDDSKLPTRHFLSSQIACINHLFPFRNDKTVIESIVNLPNAEKIDDGYIAFEFVHQNRKYLNETFETRGKNCTSIDAFVKANGVGIGIEWKYTETDYNTADAKVRWNDEDHQKRYKPLLENSNIQADYDVLVSCQMYYELMRQTLLLEQMKAHNEIIDYQNIVVCSKKNVELYQCCENWKNYLKDISKFKVISPKELLQNIDKQKYGDLLTYLQTRYWQ